MKQSTDQDRIEKLSAELYRLTTAEGEDWTISLAEKDTSWMAGLWTARRDVDGEVHYAEVTRHRAIADIIGNHRASPLVGTRGRRSGPQDWQGGH